VPNNATSSLGESGDGESLTSAAMADQEAHEAALEEKGECTHLPHDVPARSRSLQRTDRRRGARRRAFSGH